MSEHYLVKDDKRIELLEETTFGRSDDCDVKLTEGHPSRQHAKVTVADDGVWIEDLGSVNGTFINDNEVTGRTRLVAGDMVSFDIESYRFESAVDDQATVMRPLPPDDEPLTVMRPITEEPPAAPEHVPKSWADPEYQDQQGTRIFTPEQLRAYAGGAVELEKQTQSPHLTVLSGQHADTTLQFDPASDAWSVGTDAEHALVLSDDGVSAFHAKIVHEGQRWKLIDQMSANGTFINDQKTTVGFLTSGDRVRFGPVECIVTLPKGGRQAKSSAEVEKKAASGKKAGSNTWLITAGVTVVTIIVLVVLSRLL